MRYVAAPTAAPGALWQPGRPLIPAQIERINREVARGATRHVECVQVEEDVPFAPFLLVAAVLAALL
ncbi:MAG: hypothetical protein AB1505_14330 [Candidatus Latescibacterota bacterium]